MALAACGVLTDKMQKEMVNHGLTMFPIACYDGDLPLVSIPWHWHDEFEFIMIVDGTARIQIENTTMDLSTGDAVFINSGVLHAIDTSSKTKGKYHSLVFHSRLVGGSMESIFYKNILFPLLQDKTFRYLCMNHSVSWQDAIIHDMDMAWQAVANESYDYENYVRYHLTKAMRILTENTQNFEPKVSSLDKQSAERTKTMIQFIEEHYNEDLTLESIAQSATISKSVCLRCFHRIIDTTPIQYLLNYRLEMAAAQLSQTDDKVNEIAMRCGFSDISYFTKCFRQWKGFTPVEYRKKNSV